MLTGKKIIYGVTGSIAAVKAPIMARELSRRGAEVHCALTESAKQFTTPYALSILTGNEAIAGIFPNSGKGTWHVHLGRSANAMLIAPCSAAALGKLRHGIYDNAVLLLASSLGEQTDLVIAPAMDEEMWLQPAVQENIDWLREKGVKIIEPEKGILASGNTGYGRMLEPHEIVGAFEEFLNNPRSTPPASRDRHPSLAGKRILITGGPTYEPIDPVRFIGNRSSGKMGAALATEAAHFFGADVTLIMGPSLVSTASTINRIDVETAEQMREEVLSQLPGCDILIMNAAVSDFRPAKLADTKIKKTKKKELKLDLIATRDILKDVMSIRKSKQKIIGFALEGGIDAEEYAKEKLASKELDMIVLNRFDDSGSGFTGDTNRIHIFTNTGIHKEFPLLSKTECARIILSLIAETE